MHLIDAIVGVIAAPFITHHPAVSKPNRWALLKRTDELNAMAREIEATLDEIHNDLKKALAK
jgi:hypothetical protein